MTTSDPTTPDEHIDYRIMAISDALTEHRHSWVTQTDEGIAFDTDLAGIVAVAAIEAAMEEDEMTGRICRHLCHDVEREDNIRAMRFFAEEEPEYKVLVEQLALVIMEESE